MFAHVLIQESLSSEHLTTKSTLPLDTTMLEFGSILCIISALYHSKLPEAACESCCGIASQKRASWQQVPKLTYRSLGAAGTAGTFLVVLLMPLAERAAGKHDT